MRRQETDERWGRLLTLLEPFHHQALRTARMLGRSSDDGDDLYQEAVLRAFDKLAALRDEERFRAWFFAVLVSVHRSRCRRAFWRRMVPLERLRAEGAEPVDERGGRFDERTLRARRAARMLASLPAGQREALVLFEMEAFTVEEIAAAQGVSVSAVKSRLSRGRKSLRRRYARDGAPADRERAAAVLSRAVEDGGHA